MKGTNSKIELEGPNYSGRNPLETYPSMLLVSYLSSAFSAIERGQIDIFKTLEIESAISNFYDPELMENFMQEFSSPGKFEIFVRNVALATFMSIGVASATSDLPLGRFADNLIVENTVEGNLAVEQQEATDKYKFLLNSLGQERLDDLEALGKKAKNTIGLNSTAKIKADTEATQ